MEQIEEKDAVTLTYVGKLDDGTVFQTVTIEEPIEVVIGNGDLPPTLEEALMGMKVGDKRTVSVESEEGYGPRMKDLLQDIKRQSLGDNVDPRPGMIVTLTAKKDGQDHQVPATIVEVKDDIVTIDYNHPLAGHNLTYDLEVAQIKKRSEP